MRDLARILIITGAVLIAAGVAFRLGLGRLPGDFAFRRGNFGCYFPLASSILLSLALSIVLWLLRR